MRGLCRCGRAERGFMFQVPRHARRLGQDYPVEWFCSIKCMDRRAAVKDATHDELAAIEAGGQCGGEYLDSINKTDLAKLSHDEWATFCRCVVNGYVEEMQRRVVAPF